MFIRAPWVEDAGEGVEVLGRVVGGPADGKIVAVRQGNVVATSFHPELTGDRRVHAMFVDLVRRDIGRTDIGGRDSAGRDSAGRDIDGDHGDRDPASRSEEES